MLFGRFVGVLRALVPAVAGDSRLNYRTFLFWNVLGAVIASPAVIIAGYYAGSSYKELDGRLSHASWVLAACAAAYIAWRVVKSRKQAAADDETGASAPERSGTGGDDLPADRRNEPLPGQVDR